MKKIALAIAFLLSAAGTARSGRLFTCGFEENNLLETMWTQILATSPSIVTSPVNSGTHALKTSASQGNSGVRRMLAGALPLGTTVWLRTKFRWVQQAAGTRLDIGVVALGRGVDALGVEVRLGSEIDNDGRFFIRNNSLSPVQTTVGTFQSQPDTWYRLEVRYVADDVNGEIELNVYDDATGQLLDTISRGPEDTAVAAFEAFDLGNTKAGLRTFEFYYDDVALNDDSGAFQNSWPGPGNVYLLGPTTPDVSVQWTPAGTPTPAPTNAEGVDDIDGVNAAPNDDVDRNESTGTTNLDQLALTDLGAEVPANADIVLLDVYGRQGSDGTTGQRTLVYRIWDENGTPTDGPAVDCAINGWRLADTDEHLVFDAGTRSKADITNFNIGYKANQGTTVKRITAQWVNVEWVEAPPGRLFILTVSE